MSHNGSTMAATGALIHVQELISRGDTLKLAEMGVPLEHIPYYRNLNANNLSLVAEATNDIDIRLNSSSIVNRIQLQDEEEALLHEICSFYIQGYPRAMVMDVMQIPKSLWDKARNQCNMMGQKPQANVKGRLQHPIDDTIIIVKNAGVSRLIDMYDHIALASATGISPVEIWKAARILRDERRQV